ncbi:MAG: 50S ribosomal protein L27 [Flavobacteriales bacterium]|nr:50S ribosomal protein L27 [Flavobacteriales bacterium]
MGIGVDHTLFATADGVVTFRRQRGHRSVVSVLAAEAVADQIALVAKKKAPKSEVLSPTKTAAPKAAATSEADDLTKVEGIGPKIAEHFNAAGINSFAELASTSVDRLQEILTEAGPNFASHNPGTWPKQAELAAAGKWDELKAWQDELDGGK